MNTPQSVSLDSLLAHAVGSELRQFGLATSGCFYADTRGFHVYAKLGLTLRLSAAEDDRAANRHLRILETYVSIIDSISSMWGARILEVQGEVVHLLMPAEFVDVRSVSKVIGFSAAATSAVYAHIPKLAKEHFDGFKTAADHGRCIVVGLGDEAASVVSLGPAANAPAKKLPEVAAANLCLRREHWAVFSGQTERPEWVETNVLNPTEIVRRATEAQSPWAGFTAFSANFRWADLSPNETPIQFRQGTFSFSASSTPIRAQGFFFRADLDGFSAQVLEAFSSGSEEAIRALVNRFQTLVGYAAVFRKSLAWPSIALPWAGDCTNIILLPRDGQTYGPMREAAPVLCSKSWHEQFEKSTGSEQRWSALSAGARWAVGMAGGDDTEGNSGVVLVANLLAAGRRFAVAAGWSVRRSSDAYQASGVQAGDTVLPTVDRRALEAAYQEAFIQLDTRFDRAALTKLQRAVTEKQRTLSIKHAIYVAPNIHAPTPRPYAVPSPFGI